MESVIACQGCDQLYRHRPLARGEKTIRRVCGTRLDGSTIDTLQHALALNLAALVLLAAANIMFFLHVSMEGTAQSNLIDCGVLDLYQFTFLSRAALIGFTTILAPLVKILVTLYVVSSALMGRRLPGVTAAMRATEVLSTWSMLEV